MYDRILVPTDGSECADSAVEHAIDIAGQYDAELHVLSVIDARDVSHSAPAISIEQVEQTLRERAESVVEDVAARAEETGVSVVTAVEPGLPDDTLVEYADEHDCDLIVMGTHGRTGIQRRIIGSVAEQIVRDASIPVLTVKTEDRES